MVARDHLAGSRVVGTGEDLGWTAAELGATTVVLAVAKADEQFLRDVTARTDALGLKLLVIPPLEEIGADVPDRVFRARGVPRPR